MNKDEQLIVFCAGCGIPVLTWWAENGGGLLRGEYVLWGDTICHPKCYDVMTNISPIKAKTDRVRANYLGIRKQSRFPAVRTSRWKKKVDGTVVARDQ